jgi:hypothetical protein
MLIVSTIIVLAAALCILGLAFQLFVTVGSRLAVWLGSFALRHENALALLGVIATVAFVGGAIKLIGLIFS